MASATDRTCSTLRPRGGSGCDGEDSFGALRAQITTPLGYRDIKEYLE